MSFGALPGSIGRPVFGSPITTAGVPPIWPASVGGALGVQSGRPSSRRLRSVGSVGMAAPPRPSSIRGLHGHASAGGQRVTNPSHVRRRYDAGVRLTPWEEERLLIFGAA